MLKTEQPSVISPATPVRPIELTEKVNLLSENVQSLLDRDQTIEEEILTIKSDFEAMTKGLINQVRQINVSSISFWRQIE